MIPNSPFKFLDSYSKEDKEIFFGRENETEEIYTKIFQSNLLLIYGASGTGKSSLISCGLANKFQDTDWLPINIRRGLDINKSIISQLNKIAITPIKKKDKGNIHLRKLIKSIYLDYFKPVFLIFDQFEELFIFGNREEWLSFIEDIKIVLESDLQVKLIFVIRGEYLEYLSEFEEVLPDFFDNRVRIEKMTRRNALQCITGPCKAFDIQLEENFAENLLAKLSPEKAEIELTYLQVFLDRIFKTASDNTKENKIVFTNSILNDLGNIGDVLSEFLDDQINQIPNSEQALALLKAFVTTEGTKKQISVEEATDFANALGQEISIKEVESTINELVNRRILKDKDEAGRHELRHDSIAEKIFQKITQYERDLIEVRQFLDYAYNEHVKRDFLLNESDLAYVTPYEEKLHLSREILDFVAKCKKIVRRKQRSKKQFYTVVGIIVLLLISSVALLIFSLQQQTKAEELAKVATIESEKAQRQSNIAQEQRAIAEQNARETEQQANLAREQSQLAEEQRALAEDQRSKAEQLRLDAEAQRSLALEEKQRADDARVLAERSSQEAENQRKLAEEERSKTERLRMISIAQSLGTKSIQIQDKMQKSLLALQALQFNQEFDGYEFQADIYNGLYSAHKALQGDDFNIIDLHQGPLKAILPYQNMAITAGSDGKILKVNFSEQKITSEIFAENPLIYHSMAISLDNKFLALGSEEGIINLYDLANQKLIRNLEDIHKAGIWALAFMPDDSGLISAGNDKKIIYWDMSSFEHYEIGETESIINAISVHPKTNFVIAGLATGEVIEFLTEEKSTLNKLNLPNPKASPITKVSFNYAGNLLAIGNEAGNVMLWDISKQEVFQSLTGHRAMITDIEFRSDDKFMLTSSFDRTAKLWNMDNINERPIVFSDHENWVLTASFTHDGKDILTGDATGLLKIYPLDMSVMSKDFCQLIDRNLTLDEWNNFVGDDISYRNTCKSLSLNK